MGFIQFCLVSASSPHHLSSLQLVTMTIGSGICFHWLLSFHLLLSVAVSIFSSWEPIPSSCILHCDVLDGVIQREDKTLPIIQGREAGRGRGSGPHRRPSSQATVGHLRPFPASPDAAPALIPRRKSRRSGNKIKL